MVKDPQLNARGFFLEFEQPCMGKVKLPKLPFYSKEVTWSFSRPAPALGQHNEEVYGEIGLSKKDLVTLKGAGVI
jgi:crotonobetainyl-CoA:carnitine CoA-transferase CaiB-like acyl-CoA transferase